MSWGYLTITYLLIQIVIPNNNANKLITMIQKIEKYIQVKLVVKKLQNS